MKHEIFIPLETVPKSYEKTRKSIILSDKARRYHTEATEFLKRHAPKEPLKGYIKAEYTFFMKRLESHKNLKYPNVKPDHDNMIKAVQDCLEMAGFVENDSRIVWCVSRKIFAGGEDAGGVVQVGCQVRLECL